MSQPSEEDDVLKELVTKSLQSNGVLGKIQAQLRASVFLALEDEFKERSIPLVNQRAQDLLQSPAGTLAASLLHDFLSSLGLDFSLSVFGPESNLTASLWKLQPRDVLLQRLGLHANDKDSSIPVLYSYCQKLSSHQNSVKTTSASLSENKTSSTALLRPLEVLGSIPAKTKSPADNSPIPTKNNLLSNAKDTENVPSKTNEKRTAPSLQNNNNPSRSSSANSKSNTFKDSLDSISANSSKSNSNKAVANTSTTKSSSTFSSTKVSPSNSSTQSKSSKADSSHSSFAKNIASAKLPPSNILSEPPLDEWEDSSESSSSFNAVNNKQLIKTLINQVKTERPNSAAQKAKVQQPSSTESEYQDDFSSNSTSERSSHSNSKSSEKTITPSQGETPEEETIATDEDVSFGDIISDASQKTDETEDKSAASLTADYAEDL